MDSTQKKRFESLYEQHLNALTRLGKSKKTIELYARPVRRISAFFDTCPDALTADDLKTFFTALVKSHSWSTVKTDRNGLQFFYKHVLGRQWQWVEIVKPPVVKRLPDILTSQELSRMINGAREARYQTYILTTYSMGLRLGEALNLRIGDIDAQRKQVHIRDGKGHKDRYVHLPPTTLRVLRHYWAMHRNPAFLFPQGKTPEIRFRATRPMDRGGLQKAFQVIAKDCGIHKSVSIHTLRHCYGTHLMEQGVNLRAIQKQMGHECPKTTAIYTQLTQSVQNNTEPLIDQLVDRLSFTLINEEG